MTERVILEPGMPAPTFALSDQYEAVHSLDELRGTKVILFFYPAAMTPGCTTEACDFRDSAAPLTAAGYQVLGISRDDSAKLKRFAERDSLAYPLLSDPESLIHKAYGAFGKKTNYGRIIEGVIRSTFVINEAGEIEHALYNVKATGHVARVRKLLGV